MVCNLIYITASNIEEARRIARSLVEKRLVACVNIVPEIESLYWWEEKVCEDKEVLILAKTTKAKTKQVIEEVKKIHSYKVPAISVFDIVEGNEDFLEWITSEVSKGVEKGEKT